MEGCLKQGALAGAVNSTSVSWTRIQWRHESLCYVWRSWCERNRTRAICTTLHDGILYGCYTDGPSERCSLKKHEKCFVKKLSALFAGFLCFVGAFNLHFRPGLPMLGLGWVRCDKRHSPVHAGVTLRLIPRDDSLCSQALWTMSQGSVLCCTRLLWIPGYQLWKSDQLIACSPSGLFSISSFLSFYWLLFSYVQFIRYASIIHIFNRATLMGIFIVVYRPAVSSHSLCISVIACNDTGQQLWLFLRQEIVSGELTYLRQTVCAALRSAAQTCLLRFLAPLLKPTGSPAAYGSRQVCWGLVGCARYTLGHSRLDTARYLR